MTETDPTRVLKLQSQAADVGCIINVDQTARCLEFAELLRKWNQRIRLVGPRDIEDIIALHVVDSLACVPEIPPRASTVLDVGSGGGLPGAIIALVKPHLQVTSVEPINKKCAFQRAAKRELGLVNFNVICGRLEHQNGSFDVAVSRATWAVPQWVERARSFVGDKGIILAMEGKIEYELPDGSKRREYSLEGRTRSIVTIPARQQ